MLTKGKLRKPNPQEATVEAVKRAEKSGNEYGEKIVNEFKKFTQTPSSRFAIGAGKVTYKASSAMGKFVTTAPATAANWFSKKTFLGKLNTGFSKWASGKSVFKALDRAIPKLKTPLAIGGLALGFVAMLGINIMKGGMSEAHNVIYDRYLQDQAITKDVLNTSRVGKGFGMSNVNRYNHTVGLSNSLSRTRHGRGAY